jgi:hypothetical protein
MKTHFACSSSSLLERRQIPRRPQETLAKEPSRARVLAWHARFQFSQGLPGMGSSSRESRDRQILLLEREVVHEGHG